MIQTTDPEGAAAGSRPDRQSDDVEAVTPPLGPGLHGDAPPPAATRAAQPRLADGTRLDDRVGYRFAVLATARMVDALSSAARAGYAAADVVVVRAGGEAESWLASLGAEAVVIRPDRHILGVASTTAEFDAVLAPPWLANSETSSAPIQKTAAAL